MTGDSNDRYPPSARIPADVGRPDRVAFGLTSRQLAILAVTALFLYGLWSAIGTLIPPWALIAVTLPIVAVAFLIAVGRRDGIGLDRWLMAAWRHRRSPRCLVSAEGPTMAAPAWVRTTRGRGDHRRPPAPLCLPARGVTDQGLIDLGPDGVTALLSASTVAFHLRTADERLGLVHGFGQWLNSLDTPTQILVSAEPVDLGGLADRIAANAPSLPHPALEEAALSHAEFLDDLGQDRRLLRRGVTIALRDRHGGGQSAQRAATAARALAGCEATGTVLDEAGALTTLAARLDPATTSTTSLNRR